MEWKQQQQVTQAFGPLPAQVEGLDEAPSFGLAQHWPLTIWEVNQLMENPSVFPSLSLTFKK